LNRDTKGDPAEGRRTGGGRGNDHEVDEKSLAGLPLFSKIPGLGVLASQQSKQEEDDELLILITPQVVRSPERSETPEIWISK